MLHLDPLDRKILRLLKRDSSQTSERLGDLVGLSPSATHRRVKALERSGAILGYGARISAAAEGNPSTVFVHVTLIDQRRETMEAFEAALRRTTQVQEAYLMSGESDYLLKVMVVETDSYERIHRAILADLPGARRLVSQFTMRTLASDGS
jgi:DNA-binding Lrp family transcriptional regulator